MEDGDKSGCHQHRVGRASDGVAACREIMGALPDTRVVMVKGVAAGEMRLSPG